MQVKDALVGRHITRILPGYSEQDEVQLGFVEAKLDNGLYLVWLVRKGRREHARMFCPDAMTGWNFYASEEDARRAAADFAEGTDTRLV